MKLHKVVGLTKLHVVVYLMVLPLTTQCQLCVCGDTSWWRGQALKLGHSYSNLPCTNTDEAQQFSTSWGCGGVAGVGESESGSLSVEVSTCWLNVANKKRSPCSTGYSATLPLPPHHHTTIPTIPMHQFMFAYSYRLTYLKLYFVLRRFNLLISLINGSL